MKPKTIETFLDIGLNDKKKFNQELVKKLKEFQERANSQMSEFVQKEKQALMEKKISNDHLKNSKMAGQKAKENRERGRRK